ncbi:hypothetical protein GBF38_000198 [Nibea albiflora]|nr:hypothetical protein GBF38_000198 [Nibea albiflora]
MAANALSRREKLHGTRTIKRAITQKIRVPEGGNHWCINISSLLHPADVETFGSEPPGARSRRIIFDRGARLACPKTERCAGRARNRDAPLNLEVGVGGGTRLKPLLPSSSLPSATPQGSFGPSGGLGPDGTGLFTLFMAANALSRREKLHGTRTIKRAITQKIRVPEGGNHWCIKISSLLHPADVETFGSEPPGARSRRIIFDRGARLACPKTERCARRARNRDAPLNLEVGVGGGTRLKPLLPSSSLPSSTPQGSLAPLGGSARTEQGCLHFLWPQTLYLGEKSSMAHEP